MLDVRTLALAVLLFGITFGGVSWWIGSGTATATINPSPSPPSDDEPPPPFKADPAADEAVRQAVVRTAMSYRGSQCSTNAKGRYVVAATNYAARLMRSAGCRDFSCPGPTSRLEQVWRANRTPDDHAVVEAMSAVNLMGGVVAGDFPGDVGRAVRLIAGSDFGQGQSCVASSRHVLVAGVGGGKREETRKAAPPSQSRSPARFRFRRR